MSELTDLIKNSNILENNPYINMDEVNRIREFKIPDFEQSSIEDYEQFEEDSWKMQEGYQSIKFKSITDKMEGLGEGMYLFAGPANSGYCVLFI